MYIQRRNFIQLVSQTVSSGVILSCGNAFAQNVSLKKAKKLNSDSNPHFLLQVSFSGGFDASNLFDARPQRLTAAGIKANFFADEPEKFTGKNGQDSWVTKESKPLLEKIDSFSILNGVVMSAGFDGHDQNTNFFFTGNPFGGEWFAPIIGGLNASAPTDTIAFKIPFSALTNLSRVVPLTNKSAFDLTGKLGGKDFLESHSSYFSKLKERYKDIAASGDTLLSVGSNRMLEATKNSKLVKETIGSVVLENPPEDANQETGILEEFKYSVVCATKLFASGSTRAVHLGVQNLPLDAHDNETAKKQPKVAESAAKLISEMIQYLKDTPFDAKRSFYDVTTFVVSTEFSRTLRQENIKIEDSGTDHNPLTNTMLIGGKNIKSGLILGASDIQTAEEKLSKVHTILDSNKLKSMGRPFDCNTGMVLNDDPESYDVLKYLSAHSVVNSLYSVFGVPTEKWRGPDRSTEKAAVLKTLLV